MLSNFCYVENNNNKKKNKSCIYYFNNPLKAFINETKKKKFKIKNNLKGNLKKNTNSKNFFFCLNRKIKNKFTY